ncbi:hypothetical protein McanCB56680_003762 [Microsporum canis]
MGFWTGWELWEQMCFVLGGLIALVLLYGTGVHIYNSWRIKKIGAAEKLKKSREEETIGTKGLDLIPFGSRALESGIEIEGIWISKNNTPQASPIPPATPEGTRPASPTCSNLDLGLAAVPREERSSAERSLSIGNGEEEIFMEAHEHSAVADKPEELDKKDSSGSSSTGHSGEISRPSPLERVGMCLRESGPGNQENKDGILTRVQTESEIREQTHHRTDSRGVSICSRSLVPHSRNQSSSHIPVEGEDHLQALHSHRQSHVAETGQLGGPWRHQPVQRPSPE